MRGAFPYVAWLFIISSVATFAPPADASNTALVSGSGAQQNMDAVPKLSVDSLTLSQVLTSVDTHYPLIIGALQDREKARGDLLSAQGAFDPVLKSAYQATPSGEYENRYFDTVIEQPTPLWGTRLFAGYRNGRGRFGPYDERLLTNNDGEVRGGLEVPLLRGGVTDDRRARIGSSQKSLEASEQSIDLQKIDSKRQASYRYFDWVAAAEKLKVAHAVLKLAQDRDEAMGHRVTRGDAARIEQIDNHRSVTQREAALVSAMRSFDKSALELSLFYRDHNGRPLLATIDQLPKEGLDLPSSAPGASEYLPRPEVLALEVLPRHPEVLRLHAQLDQNEIERKLARNSILPKLDAELMVAQDLGVGSSSKSTLEYKAALKFELPLFLRSGRGRAEALASQGAKLDAQLDLARDRIKVAISDSSQSLEASRKRILLTKNEVALSLKVEDAERVKFKHGDSNILTVNLREQATADAKSRLIDAFADFFRAQADFTAATARIQN